MKYRKYTTASINVSEIGIGAWQLGINSGWKGMSEQEAIHMIHSSFDQGVNFFDTAPNYGHGTSELRLGKAFKEMDRSKIVVNTKFGHTDKGTMDYSAGYIRESIEGSLKRMQLDYVDSLIIHNPPSEYFDGNKNDHYKVLERLKEEGKIKEYGASLDTHDDLKLLIDTTESKVVEVFFNILHQDVARAFELAKSKDVGIIVKIPLDSGWLTGKYDANSVFDGVRARWSKEDIAQRASLVGQIQEVLGEEYPLPQAAIVFCLAYDAVSTVIPGNLNMLQLESNLQAAEMTLPQEVVKKLEHFYQSEVKDLALPW